jgi:hypothetical protein
MPIVYYLDYPCEVKEEVPPGRMLRLLYARDCSNAALNRARRSNPNVAPEDVVVSLTGNRNGVRRELMQTTADNVQRQVEPLEALAHKCKGCPAGVDGSSFGCRGKIEYPISMRAETLLMSRVHASGGDPSAHMLVNFCESNGITGNRAREMRQQKGTYFESHRTLTRRLPDGRKLNSNQVFELFLQPIGAIRPGHARFLLGMFELLDTGLPLDRPRDSLPHQFVIEREDAGMPVSRTGLRLFEQPADASTRQLIRYLSALLLAAEFGKDLWIK